MMEITLQHEDKLTVPFSLGIFENCTLHLEKAMLGWYGAIEYPEKISIRNEYPYIIPPGMLHATENETLLVFYPSGDMLGGYWDNDATAILKVRIQTVDNDTVRIVLDLDERIRWVAD